jgi:hypothetical protein
MPSELLLGVEASDAGVELGVVGLGRSISAV